MSDAPAPPTQKIYVGVPTREVEQMAKLMRSNGAISVVSVPNPQGDTSVVIATLEDGRSDFKSVGEYAADVAAAEG